MGLLELVISWLNKLVILMFIFTFITSGVVLNVIQLFFLPLYWINRRQYRIINANIVYFHWACEKHYIISPLFIYQLKSARPFMKSSNNGTCNVCVSSIGSKGGGIFNLVIYHTHLKCCYYSIHLFVLRSNYIYLYISLIDLFISPSIYSTVHFSIYPFIQLSICPSIHSSNCPLIPSIHPSIQLSTSPSIQLSTSSSIHSSIHPSNCPLLHPFIHPSNYPLLHPFIHPSIHPTIHFSIHSFIPPSIQLSTPPSIHSSSNSIPPSIQLSTPPSIHSSSNYPVIHSSIHSSISNFLRITPSAHPHIFNNSSSISSDSLGSTNLG